MQYQTQPLRQSGFKTDFDLQFSSSSEISVYVAVRISFNEAALFIISVSTRLHDEKKTH